MAKVEMIEKINGMMKYQKDLLNRQNSIQSFFNKNIYRMYQKAQIKRWMTENESETGKWAGISAKYAKYKKRRFASYPGAGDKLMIATGKLSGSAQGTDNKGMNKITTNTGISIRLNLGYVSYAQFASEKRPTMKFGKATISDMRDAVKEYIKTGRLTVRATE